MTISTTTSGATIRYTTDGSTPSETAGTVYSSAVSISVTATLKAIAYQTGIANSPSPPVSTPSTALCHPDVHSGGGHLYALARRSPSAPATSGATIRYTTDGSTPTRAVGTVYSSAVTHHHHHHAEGHRL